MEILKCPNCKIGKPVSEFYKNYAGVRCISCTSQVNTNLVADSAKRFLERRNIPLFIKAVKDAYKNSGMGLKPYSRSISLGKNVIGDWINENTKPSQKLQHEISKKLSIPFEEFVFKKNINNEYACGIRVCFSCKAEFLVYKKQNHLTHNCSDCIQSQRLVYKKR